MIGLEGGLPHTWVGFIGACTSLGGIIGGMIAWYATKSERKKVAAAHAETNRVYEQTIAAQKQLIETSADNHRAEVERLVETSKEALSVMTAERDNYRTKSHDLAGELNAAGMKLKDFEMRPDLTTLYHSQQEWHAQREKFYEKMFKTQEQMQSNLKEQGEILSKLLEVTNSLISRLEESQILKHAIDK